MGPELEVKPRRRWVELRGQQLRSRSRGRPKSREGPTHSQRRRRLLSSESSATGQRHSNNHNNKRQTTAKETEEHTSPMMWASGDADGPCCQLLGATSYNANGGNRKWADGLFARAAAPSQVLLLCCAGSLRRDAASNSARIFEMRR